MLPNIYLFIDLKKKNTPHRRFKELKIKLKKKGKIYTVSEIFKKLFNCLVIK